MGTKEWIKEKELQEKNINDFFRTLKDYCKDKKKESSVPSRNLLDINKRDIIIFEADLDKMDFSIIEGQKKRVLMIPTNNLFLEIPKWKKEDENQILINQGGILLSEEMIEDRRIIKATTLWLTHNKVFDTSSIKPFSLVFFDGIEIKDNFGISKDDIWRVGSEWENINERSFEYKVEEKMFEEVREEMGILIQKILFYLLIKIEKREYNSYKKWTPTGFESKEIIYSHEVSKHKRHFWKDSGRFKIPLMDKEEWEEKGYGTDEVVFRGGELRRDTPYKIIGNFLMGKDKEKKEDNRRIKIAKGRVLRQEQKVYNLLIELFPGKYIRRHDRRTLNGLELDFNLPELRLGIEYDGEQHFDRRLCEEVFKSDFDALKKRDKEKEKRCRKKNIKLIRIKYDEPLTKTNLKKKLKEFL